MTEASTAALARKGCGSGGEAIPSIAPRSGSFIRHSRKASRRPGSAATRKANCQPEKPNEAPPAAMRWSHHWAANPPSAIDRPRPSAVATPIAAIAVPRRLRGKVSKMIELAERSGKYSFLSVDDMLGYMRRQGDDGADLIVAADALVYLSDLAPLFREVFRVLEFGGLRMMASFCRQGACPK